MRDLILKLGEPWRPEFGDELGLERADRVADFFHNGGLTIRGGGLNYALQYAAVVDGRVEIAAWVWFDDEDFDLDATWEVYCEDDFWACQINLITDKIKEIYGQKIS